MNGVRGASSAQTQYTMVASHILDFEGLIDSSTIRIIYGGASQVHSPRFDTFRNHPRRKVLRVFT
jgi:hypothetical protein